MAAQENIYGADQLVGNAELPRLSSPILRGNVRRQDPDPLHTYPYVPGLSGTTMVLELSIAGDPVPETVNIVFALAHADNFKEAIQAINAASVNVLAWEQNGFLYLQNKRFSGSRNYIKVISGTSLALLGFVADPQPGSICWAGELDSAPPTQGQDNPQGTMLIARDEDITASSINRAIIGASLQVQRMLRELDRDVVGVVEYSGVTVTSLGGVHYFGLDDPAARIPIDTRYFSDLQDLANLLNSAGEELVPIGGGGSQDGSKVKIDGIFYGGPPFNPAIFTTWGTPDSGSIFAAGGAPDVYQKIKLSSAISAIRGNVLVLAAGSLLTALVHEGDTCVISGSLNTNPFSHNGEFIVERIIDALHVALRPKTDYEDLLFPDGVRPTGLNPTGPDPGLATFYVGWAIPLSSMFFRLSQAVTPAATYKVRLAVMVKLRELLSSSLAKPLVLNTDAVGKQFRTHVDEIEPGTLHHADKVTTTNLPAWYGDPTDLIAAGRVQGNLESIVNYLATLNGGAVLRSGADRIGSAASAGTPRSLADGSVRGQLIALLGFYNNHVNVGTADRHRALDVDKSQAGPNFADGQGLGTVTVQAAFDAVVNSLASSTLTVPPHDGAAKIGIANLSGAPRSLPGPSATNTPRGFFSDLLGYYNNHVGAVADKHPDTDITSVNRTHYNGLSVHAALDDIDSKAGWLAVQNHWSVTQYLDGGNYGTYSINNNYFQSNWFPARDAAGSHPAYLTGRNTPKAMFFYRCNYPVAPAELLQWGGYNSDHVYANGSLLQIDFEFRNALDIDTYLVLWGYRGANVPFIPRIIEGTQTVNGFSIELSDPRTQYDEYTLNGLTFYGFALCI